MDGASGKPFMREPSTSIFPRASSPSCNILTGNDLQNPLFRILKQWVLRAKTMTFGTQNNNSWKTKQLGLETLLKVSVV